ncbi:uncharacterized protein F5147DRAFT_773686 [Suillus discolor]|uniref:Uncharacterized protein n=1 Tax=Suillus discolor TaxID=1912936 RepID=A0A9P7F814_9AGAM|nr:uncharacterized protein F5147DRAFT_773686 [Suillus discolor]KAG2108490.1 hypothetical protein F5147DRAFT_773686 [Suillus discolor]
MYALDTTALMTDARYQSTVVPVAAKRTMKCSTCGSYDPPAVHVCPGPTAPNEDDTAKAISTSPIPFLDISSIFCLERYVCIPLLASFRLSTEPLKFTPTPLPDSYRARPAKQASIPNIKIPNGSMPAMQLTRRISQTLSPRMPEVLPSKSSTTRRSGPTREPAPTTLRRRKQHQTTVTLHRTNKEVRVGVWGRHAPTATQKQRIERTHQAQSSLDTQTNPFSPSDGDSVLAPPGLIT